jgi:hypothetical protein
MQDLQQYGAWRARVAASLTGYGSALRDAGLIDAAGEQLLARARWPSWPNSRAVKPS